MSSLIPIAICVVLPVLIVLIVSLVRINTENKRAFLLSRLIEKDRDVNTGMLASAFNKPLRSQRDILNIRLLRACLFSFIGIFLLAVGVIIILSGSNISSDPAYFSLFFGGASLSIGLSYTIVYLVTRKQIDKSDDNKA